MKVYMPANEPVDMATLSLKWQHSLRCIRGALQRDVQNGPDWLTTVHVW